MSDPEKFHLIKRLPPDVFAGIDRLVQRAGGILPEHSQTKETGA